MFIIRSDKTLFCDVDDTLVLWSPTGASYKPHQAHIDLIKRFHKRGQPVIVWSAGGYEWALKIVKELGLEPYVTAVMAKPMWYVDDLTSPEFLPEVNRIYLKDETQSEPFIRST